LPTISIAHTDGVALGLAAASADATIGIAVERVVEQDADFERTAFSQAETELFGSWSGTAGYEWIARLTCAKEALAKATGQRLVAGPAGIEIVHADPRSGEVAAVLGPDLAAACPQLGTSAIRIVTVRQGDYAWAWTAGERIDR
jgi:phosphopantetheinyl transferase